MPTSLPRTSRNSSGDDVYRSRPPSRARPDTEADAGSSPSNDIAVTVLPEPDSPTTARTSPAVSENETSLTAGEPEPKSTETSSTDSSTSLT